MNNQVWIQSAITGLLSLFLLTGCLYAAGPEVPPMPTATPEQEAALGLPPDPGEAGKETLLGIDSDGDGVRDDIQRYIALTYPDSARKREAMRQNARAMNQALANAEDKRKSIKNSYQLDYSQECLFYIFGDVREAAKERKKMKALILNTLERTVKFLKFDSNLAGEIFTSNKIQFWGRSCQFNPDALPN